MAIITPAAIPPASALAQVRMSGAIVAVLVGEPLAGPAQAGLDLVEDQEHAPLVAELAQAGQVVGRRDVDPPLALDRLDQDGGRLVVEHAGDGVRSLKGTYAKPGTIGSKPA